MSSAIFFLLVCLGPIAVMCDNKRWTPLDVATPSQQCLELQPKNHYVGACEIGPEDTKRNLCRGLKCAFLKSDGTYDGITLRNIAKGTVCGTNKACKNGQCIDIDPNHVPRETGATATFKCIEAYMGWPPRHVRTAAQQCHDINPAYKGTCNAIAEDAGKNPCTSLKCALLNADGTYSRVAVPAPVGGTPCGGNKVCKSRKCTDIGQAPFPTLEGITAAFDCVQKRPGGQTSGSGSNKRPRI